MDAITLEFSKLPSVWMAYPRALLARRPSLVRDGHSVPRIEARIDALEVDKRHLGEYRRVCGFPADERLPLTYPHVLAMPLHMAMLTHDAFPVKLLGLVHVRNVIRSRARIAQDATLSLSCSLEGHREIERGQEFDLVTECKVDGRPVWSETSTFLARRKRSRSAAAPASGKPAAGNGSQAPTQSSSAPASAGKPESEPSSEDRQSAVKAASWHADANIGRRYGAVSGDINPIHMADLTARLFGFDQAIAHGMWSLARTVAELDADGASDAVEIDASFKLPILLPAWVNLHSWQTVRGRSFALKDAQGEKPHAAGTFNRL